MLLEKIILGITLAAPIGPVSIEMIKRGLSKGFLGAFIVRVGGAMGNTLCLIAAYFGASLLVNSETKMGLCSLAGAIVLIYLGAKSLFNTHAKQNDQISQATTHSMAQVSNNYKLSNGLLTGFILSIANPIGIVFWLSIFAGSIDRSGETSVWLGLLENFSVIAGVLIWGLMLSSLLAAGKRFVNQKGLKLITMAAGAMLIYFALKYAYRGIEILF